jgi:hypothetical protein
MVRGLVEWVQGLLEDTGLDPGALTLGVQYDMKDDEDEILTSDEDPE